jgi:hypothetical protein
MAIEKQTSSNSAPRFAVKTGMVDFHIKKVFPTNAELKELGVYVKDGADEPVYMKPDKNGVNSCMITVAGFLTYNGANNELISEPFKFGFFTNESYKKSANGKFRFINQVFNTSWATSAEELESNKYMGRNVRKCFNNEDVLMEIVTKANDYSPTMTKKDDKGNVVENVVMFDNKPFTKEWYKEIKEALENTQLKIMLAVEYYEGKPMQKAVTMSNAFNYHWATANANFIKTFEKGFKYNNDYAINNGKNPMIIQDTLNYNLNEYIEKPFKIDNTIGHQTTTEEAPSVDTDDLPF